MADMYMQYLIEYLRRKNIKYKYIKRILTMEMIDSIATKYEVTNEIMQRECYKVVAKNNKVVVSVC